MEGSTSVCAAEALVCCQIREGRATLGIDVVAVRPARVGESVRIDMDLLDEVPLRPEMIPDVFRLLEPVFPRCGKHLRVLHDGKDTGVVFSVVPRNSDGANGGGHG